MTSRIASKRPRISVRSRLYLTVFAALSLLLVFACGPAPPRTGTPAFYWGAAKEAYTFGDYMKTIDHLDNILEADNDYTARAYPWSLLVTSGLASGYMDLADQYEAGAKANKESSASFSRQVSRYRSLASHLTLRFADSFAKFGKTKEDPVTLAFAFPPGTAAPVPELARVAKGAVLPVAQPAPRRSALSNGPSCSPRCARPALPKTPQKPIKSSRPAKAKYRAPRFCWPWPPHCTKNRSSTIGARRTISRRGRFCASARKTCSNRSRNRPTRRLWV